MARRLRRHNGQGLGRSVEGALGADPVMVEVKDGGGGAGGCTGWIGGEATLNRGPCGSVNLALQPGAAKCRPARSGTAAVMEAIGWLLWPCSASRGTGAGGCQARTLPSTGDG
jgi:hypothetical protein